MDPIQILLLGELPIAFALDSLRGSAIHRAAGSHAVFQRIASGEIDVVVQASSDIADLLAHCARFEVPLIVAGSLSDQDAAALIEAGAYDCVPPDQPQRLGAVIARAARLHAASSLQRVVLEATADGLLVVGCDGKVLAYNTRFAEMWDLQPGIAGYEALLEHIAARVEDDVAFLDLLRARPARAPAAVLGIAASADGRTYEISSAPHRGGQVFSFSDITVRADTGEALRRSEEHYRFLFENSHDSVLLFDPWSEVILDANFAADDLYRVPRGTLRGRSLLEFTKDPEPGRMHAAELLTGAGRVDFESTQVRDDGSEIMLEICAAAIPYDDRIAILSTNRDVTAQKTALIALAASEDRYRTLFDRATVGIVQGDLAGNIVTVNPALAQMLGYADVHELTKVSSGDLYADAGVRDEIIATLVGGASSVRREVRLVGRDGRRIWVDVNISTARDPNGRIRSIEAYLLDITTRRAAEEHSKRLMQDLRLVLESTNEGIVAVDTEGRCTLVNAAAARMLGRASAEVLGRPLHEVVHQHAPGAVPAVEADRPIHAQEPFSREDLFRRKDGTAFPIELAGSPIVENGVVKGTVIAFRDVTQRKALERQLEATQRISGLGRVAATIAHEFNNVLMAILPMVDVIERRLPDERLRKSAGTIRAAVSRGKRITGEILRFTRREKGVLQPLSVGAYLAELRGQLAPILDRGVDLQIDAPPADLTMLADGGELQQVFVNLAANAGDAMRGSGRVSITASREKPGDFRNGALHDVDRFVHFVVRDTGCGMDAATQAQIFEPLFTTKPSGTGIGLAVVHQIVVEHGGAIFVESEPGDGTTFDLFIPLTEQPVQTAVPAEPRRSSTTPGTYTVLLVEDDPDVAAAMQMLLETEGHSVHVIAAGEAAEEAVARLSPDLVVLDVGLPDISGTEVYERLSRRWSELPIIFATGHADIAALRDRVAGARVGFLMKPFPIDALADAIATVMSDRG